MTSSAVGGVEATIALAIAVSNAPFTGVSTPPDASLSESEATVMLRTDAENADARCSAMRT